MVLGACKQQAMANFGGDGLHVPTVRQAVIAASSCANATTAETARHWRKAYDGMKARPPPVASGAPTRGLVQFGGDVGGQRSCPFHHLGPMGGMRHPLGPIRNRALVSRPPSLALAPSVGNQGVERRHDVR